MQPSRAVWSRCQRGDDHHLCRRDAHLHHHDFSPKTHEHKPIYYEHYYKFRSVSYDDVHPSGPSWSTDLWRSNESVLGTCLCVHKVR